MNETAVFTKVAAELQIKPGQVAATAELLAGGGTVPFIARYRKEVTGMLDEVQITNVRDRLLQLAELDQRRGAIVKSLEERNLMTDALRVQIGKAETMARLEDIFAPFRPKRRTRATIAKEKGLEPLAEWLRWPRHAGQTQAATRRAAAAGGRHGRRAARRHSTQKTQPEGGRAVCPCLRRETWSAARRARADRGGRARGTEPPSWPDGR